MSVIEFLYLANCVICTVAYLPQLCSLAKDKTDSSSISIATWMMWEYTGIVGLAYAVFVNGDALFILSTALNLVFCTTTVGLLCFNRYFKYKISGMRDGVSLFDLMKREHAPAPAYVRHSK